MGELTDAFDGFCAKKWPFRTNKIPKYRKYAEKYDMTVDVLLLMAMLIFVILRVDWWIGVGIAGGEGMICLVIELVAYRKLFGHPNDFRRGALYERNAKRAEKILLMRRRLVYIPSIVALISLVLMATDWSTWGKVGFAVVGVIVGGFLWFFLKVRREKVARD